MLSNVTRRSFISGAGLAATGLLRAENAPEAARNAAVWRGWRTGEFQAHFIHTGICESVFLILPDGTSALIDCGDGPAVMMGERAVPVPNPRKMAGEQVADYVLKTNPRGADVDYMIVSHLHSDHTGTPLWQAVWGPNGYRPYCRSGFGIAAEKLHFAKAIDRGYPNYDDPIPFRDATDRELEHLKKVYAHLRKTQGTVIERFRLGATDQIVPRHGPVADFESFNVCANGKVACRDGRVIDSAKIFRDHGKWVNENAYSLGHVFTYGRFRLGTFGDFSHGMWLDGAKVAVEDALAGAVGPVDVAKINHHGYHSMSEKLVAALRARCYVACVWDQAQMTPDTLARLASTAGYAGPRTVYPSVYTRENLAKNAAQPWLGLIPEAVRGDGAHVVVSVPPGGRTYTVTCLDPTDPALRVKAETAYESFDKS